MKLGAVTPTRRFTPQKSVERSKTSPASSSSRKTSSLSPVKNESSQKTKPSPRPEPSAARAATKPEDVLDEHDIPVLSNAPDQWVGWCEIESDPAFFNVILKDWGVKGAKVYEVISLDDEILDQIPSPVFGLVFLFRWMEHGDEPQQDDASLGSGSKVWFANQIVDNACATIALLNILMNVSEGIEIGEHLAQFKDFTKDLTPATRGLAIDNFEFIKNIHNSFGRKLDMLADDLEFVNKAESASKRTAKKRRTKEVPALHFNAFVPLEGQLFKLDGVEEQPCSLGPLTSENWLADVRATLEDRMNAYQIRDYEFAILAVAQDPLPGAEIALNSVLQDVSKITEHIDKLSSDWAAASGLSANQAVLLTAQQPAPGVGEAMMEASEARLAKILTSTSLPEVLAYRGTLHQMQQELTMLVTAERHSARDDTKKARNRRFDYEPAIRYWISCLARQGRLKEMLDMADLMA